MPDIPDITPFVHAFCSDHPEWLAHVSYVRVAESDEPEMVLTFDAIRAFLRWSQKNPHITKMRPDRIHAVLARIDRIEREAGDQ